MQSIKISGRIEDNKNIFMMLKNLKNMGRPSEEIILFGDGTYYQGTVDDFCSCYDSHSLETLKHDVKSFSQEDIRLEDINSKDYEIL